MYTLLQETNRSLQKRTLQFAQELVQIPSPSLQERNLADRIEQEMQKLHYDKVFRDETGNVIGILMGKESEPTVLLNSHMDTVPVEREDLWVDSPFSGKIENGCMHGIGSSDCKGGLAAQVYAGALLNRSLLPLRGNLVVSATAMEANGRSVGVRALMEHTLPELGLTPTYAILGEPTNLGLYYGQDGCMVVEIRVEGANPFHVGDAAHAIYETFITPAVPNRLESITLQQPSFEDQKGLHRATIQMNRRLGISDQENEVLHQIHQNASMAVQSSGSVAVEVMVRQDTQRMYNGQMTVVRNITNAWTTDPFQPLLDRSRQALTAAGCKVHPGKWELGRLGMGTAGSTLVNEFQVPTIGYGPGREEIAHTINESVETNKILEAVYGTAVIVHGLIGIPVFGWTSDEI
jgi:acetylornithine deacetylase/succinyl-diaminopimelate desuccinylase-like protein